MKPVIGITPLWDEQKDSIWMLPAYMDGVSEGGGTSLMFPFTEDEEDVIQLLKLMDGVLLTGGQDVSPEIYSETPLYENVTPCAKRDTLEKLVFKHAMAMKKPVLGICRGFQFINASLGGTLYQDLPSQRATDIVHRQPAPYDEPSHEVRLEKESPLGYYLNSETIQVNSCHHQGVKELAEPLAVMATASDGLVEAAYMPDYDFMWAVQWHPEFMYKKDENSRKIFRAFVDAARG